MAAAATAAERHAARARAARPATRLPRRISGPAVARPRAVPAPTPVTDVFERIRALPDHRVIDRLLRGRVWICFIGVALMGIVAMQVSMLKLNSGISRAVETSATLERQNSDMEASIARLASGERIRAAADRDGMVMPAAGAVHYLRVRGPLDAARAAGRMRPPSDAAKALMANHGVVPGSLIAAPPVAPAATTTTATTTAAAPTPTATAPVPTATPAPVVTPAPTVQPTSGSASPGGSSPASPPTAAPVG